MSWGVLYLESAAAAAAAATVYLLRSFAPPHATHACLSHLHSSHIFPSDVELVTSLLKPLKVVRFDPADPEVVGLLPGEVAIIDQWICAHAR